jgi:serine/threonine protein phosphatase PrpC
MEGDIIVLATDGLFDNVWDKDILQVMKETSRSRDLLDSKKVAQSMKSMNFAEALAEFAYQKATSREETPFGMGKLDGTWI